MIPGRDNWGPITVPADSGDELARRFPEAAGIEADILEFLEVARERFWIELR